jgi:hypothetical protein
MLLWRPAVPSEICISSYAFATVAVLGGTASISFKWMITFPPSNYRDSPTRVSKKKVKEKSSALGHDAPAGFTTIESQCPG